jgi:uncharacterized membrane protein YcjF (UPF0283 family)
LEFPAESIGLMARCPHCAQETELVLAAPPQEPWVPRRVVVWTVVTILGLVLGLIVSLVGLKQVQKRAALQRENAAAAHGKTNNPAESRGPKS